MIFKRLKKSPKFLPFLSIFTICILLLSVLINTKVIHFRSNNLKNIFNKNVTAGGYYYNSPKLFLYNYDGKNYSSGGLIPQTTAQEPVLEVTGYNIPTTKFDVDIYKVDEAFLYLYLVYDKDYQQVGKLNLSQYQKIASFTKELEKQDKDNSDFNLPLPLEGKGIWYVDLKSDAVKTNAVIVRSDVEALVKEGDNQFIFWLQNIKTKRVVNGGQITLYNLKDSKNLLSQAISNEEGIAKVAIDAATDIAVIKSEDNVAVIPVNLKWLNYSYGGSYRQFDEKKLTNKFFTFTDRPIYRPGDKVYFKSIIRRDDDARYSIPGGTVNVEVSQGWGDSKEYVYKGSVPISSAGSISGSFALPEKVKTGNYTVNVKYSENDYGYTYFDVQYYRKPEYFLDLTTDNKALISGDNLTVQVTGQYFSGHPLANENISYRVFASDYYEYDYYSDYERLTNDNNYRYGYWYGSSELASGSITLNDKGLAEISLPASLKDNDGKDQVVIVEVSYYDATGNPVRDTRNFLVYAGDYAIFRKGYGYGSTVNTPYELPLKIAGHNNFSNLSNIPLKAAIKRVTWESYQENNKKYPSWRKVEEDLPDIEVKTDSQGEATVNFTPTKTGSYTITITGKDSKGNEIKKVFDTYIWNEDVYYYDGSSSSTLSIYAEKPEYKIGDIAKLHIDSEVADRDVLLTLERGRVDRYQTVHLDGKSQVVDLAINETDIPNIFAFVGSFNDSDVDSASKNINIDASGKKILVNITPNSKKFGPGETVTLDVEAKDINANPVQAEVAVWMVDKALYELSDSKLPDIFNTFWQNRYNNTQWAHSLEGIVVRSPAEMGGGCFAAGTKVLMHDGSYKNIEDIKTGDSVLTKSSDTSNQLVKAKVRGTHSANVGDYLIINGNLKVTANHKLFVNHQWNFAGNVQLEDVLIDKDGKDIIVTAVEHIVGKQTVYNLEIEKYNTYFANNLYVHNQKGEARSVLKDTAYWNANVWTDANGHAILSVKLPDNLTTWAISAVAATADTKVGQTTNEVVVSKDIVVRPVLPNVLREGDSAEVSALVHNFTDTDKVFTVELKFDGGEVENAKKEVKVAASTMEQVDWQISPKIVKNQSKLTFSAINKDNKKEGDTIVQTLPIKLFGFSLKHGEVGEGNKTYNLSFSRDSINKESSVTLNIAPTILGTLPTAMKYLVQYPYGCVEQTTSRFVPVVIAKDNEDLFKEAMEGKKVDDMILEGLDRLTSLQSSDGGWGWWHEGKANPYISSYVVEYLLKTKSLGYIVDDSLLNNAKNYFEKLDANNNSLKAVKAYALMLFNSDKREKKVAVTKDITPDIMALAVISNYANGVTNPQENGLNTLLQEAQDKNGSLYWRAGNSEFFGSEDASTALAIRAILFAKGDRDKAAQAARFLTASRRSNYWSNTFATAQVVRALVELSKTDNELNPNYSYKVTLDGKVIKEGKVTNAKQILKDINIPLDKVKPTSSTIEVTKEGEGQLYSTLVVNEFRTDRNYKPVNQPLKVTREIYNVKGKNYSMGAGDTVNVTLTVDNIPESQRYGVIEDHLPAGMIPILEMLNNEQGLTNHYHYYYYGNYGREYLDDGLILSLNTFSHNNSFTYQARVINPGTYYVPPAVASLMYSPEVFGASSAQTITIVSYSNKLYDLPETLHKVNTNPLIQFKDLSIKRKAVLATILLIILVAIISLLIGKDKIRQLIKRRINSNNEIDTTVQSPTNDASLPENEKEPETK